jgi:hypothetical protein
VSKRNITDADAAAIAAATAQQTPEGRREAGRRAINEQIIGKAVERRRMSNARFGRIFDKGVPEDEPDETPIDKALAEVEADRREAVAEREAAEAERDLARADREREEASA